MTYRALATDYDGTIAHDGVVDEITIDALRRARAAGVQLVLVTGRELYGLAGAFTHADVFDLLVLENGAVLYDPSTRAMQVLAEPAPPALIEALERAQMPLSVGHSIVATVRPHEDAVLKAIRDLRLDWHVIFNKTSVTALPSDVTKASGLAVALRRLEVAPFEVVGVGDAENDQPFLRVCGLSVAVSNALDEVKASADLTTAGAQGAGVRELIARLISGELPPSPRAPAGS